MSQNRQLLYPREEMVSLVRSLDRPQENGLFSQDVLLQYPELAESYTKVCPNRCDLATAADRAAKGAYGYDVQLTTLKEDIRLMVNNCILFNGAEGAYADAARTFEKFAMGKIDAYISQKVGGRRLSSFRVASVSVPEKHSTGKRGRDGESRERGPEAVDNDSSRRQPGRGNGIATSEDDSNRRSAELIKLIDSLNRREDDDAFAVDVAEAYPELKSAYEAMCPLKMNLIIMKERAQNGYYLGQQHRRRRTGDDPTLYMGSSIAESLTSLRDDVELMVRNCVNFNAGVVEWERRAASFHHFAHKKIDDFVLRIDPSLRGTRTGVEVYVQEAKKMQQSQLKQKIEGSERSNRGDVGAPESVAQSISPPSHTTATPMNPPRKATIPGTARIPTLSAHVNVVNTVTPIVQPTALQPVFNTPSTLRRRLISDHLHRETLHARLIHRLENDKSGTNGVPEIDRSGDAPQMYEPALSCRAVLDAFIISVREFHKAQRESQDFVNPFMYAQQEENLYCDYVTLIKQQLERLFLHIVLYNREKAEMYDWAAAKAAQMAVADASLLPTAPAVSSHVSCCWLDEAHLCYLVRFLQHLPQLLGLACAEVDTAKSDRTGNAQLYLTTVEQGVVGKIAKITEELLSFIARYEEKITASHQNSESLKEQAEAPAL
ncbi:Bromodomain [Trypanosoma brucei equiperdum]|uniref:Bromodomain n=1 Tax=Trypanosoma brucei equiperdum TaxID=630700 RepID=A0A3L6KXX7_9TRYP|nr:Bromodomain [Trypanosoma brucei equiperdum]